MAFNLISDAWLEARRTSGERTVIRPCDLTDGFADDPIVALDFDRPDWNAALTEWLIGLTYLVMAPKDARDWSGPFLAPPSPEALEAALAPLAPYFDLDSDGPAAFQDHAPLHNAEVKPLSGLLIEAPGEQTLKNNADLFIKRGAAESLSLAQAAAALITLQTYAPAGGAGHRTSLRGGGPLTTLLAPVRPGAKGATLWDRVWANVPDRERDAPDDPAAALPWLSSTLTSEKGAAIVTPEDRHPALAFFACPRRIRLAFDGEGRDRVAVGYRTLNYGANYEGWEHPLSPYYTDKKAGKLPLHPHAGASDYGDWVAWWGFGGQAARPVALWLDRRNRVRGGVDQALIEAFGFDMDNMKARQWLDARLPWINVQEPDLKQAVEAMIAAADVVARAVRTSARIALYGQARDDGYRLPDTLPKDALSEAADRFWRETQGPFEDLLGRLESLLADGQKTGPLRYEWLKVLRRHALSIFDETVDLDGLTDAEPRRLLYARGELQRLLSGHHKGPLLTALDVNPLPREKPALEPAEEAA